MQHSKHTVPVHRPCFSLRVITTVTCLAAATACGEPEGVRVSRAEAARGHCVAAMLVQEASQSLDSIDAEVTQATDSALAAAKAEIRAANSEFDRAADALIANTQSEEVTKRYNAARARRDRVEAYLREIEGEIHGLEEVRSIAERRMTYALLLLPVRAYADSAANHSATLADSVGYVAKARETQNILDQVYSVAGGIGQPASIWASQRTLAIRDDASVSCKTPPYRG